MKRIVSLTLIISLLFSSSIQASTWKYYLGLNFGWYEGVEGKVVKNTDSAWTVDVQSIGWGGCYGGQFYKKIKIRKNTKYTLKFTLKSSKMDKWVWVKIGNESGSQMVFGKWVDCKKGKSVTINETFIAKYNSDIITFAFGGDFGDRAGVTTDKDAKVRYKYAPNKKLDGRLPSDYSAEHPTTISLTNFSLSKNHYNKLSSTLIVMEKGNKKTLTLKDAKGKVKWSTNNKKVIRLTKKGKKVVIKAKKTGLATVKAKNKGKIYKCRIMVF